MLEKSIIPPNALFEQLNPEIASKGRPVVVSPITSIDRAALTADRYA